MIDLLSSLFLFTYLFFVFYIFFSFYAGTTIREEITRGHSVKKHQTGENSQGSTGNGEHFY